MCTQRRSAGSRKNNSKRIKVAIVGVGNCASAFIQGLFYYRSVDGRSGRVPGLIYNTIGGYRIRDIEIVAAFDVDWRKVYVDLKTAVFSVPNIVKKFVDWLPGLDVMVSPGYVGDSIGASLRSAIPKTVEDPGRVERVLRESGAEIVINYLPVGSQLAAEFYAEAALNSNAAFINAMPAIIASDPVWGRKFKKAGLPLVGDDARGVLGSTQMHCALVYECLARGLNVQFTWQHNGGGGNDFLKMTDRDCITTKIQSKTGVVMHEVEHDNVIVYPPEYRPELADTKVGRIGLMCTGFADQPIELELRMTVPDKPNSAGVITYATLATKLALDRGRSGPQTWCAPFFKRPVKFLKVPQARATFERFIMA